MRCGWAAAKKWFRKSKRSTGLYSNIYQRRWPLKGLGACLTLGGRMKQNLALPSALAIWTWSQKTLQSSNVKELTHWKRLWCWEGLGAGGKGDDRGWDGWMASWTRWTWVWVNSWSWWWTGRPGVLGFMGSQRVGHNWATELNWTIC